MAEPALPLLTSDKYCSRRCELPATEILNELELLERSPALWPVDVATWSAALASVRSFAARWGGQAHAAGWSPLELYGLHRLAPYASLAGMGAAWLVARSGHPVVDVAGAAIRLRSATGAELRIFCGALDPMSVLAWALCRPAERC